MEFGLEKIANLESEIASCGQRINGAFNSNWNDDVHDSFHDYVNSFQKISDSIIGLINQVPEFLSQLEEVNGEELIKESNELLSMIGDE